MGANDPRLYGDVTRDLIARAQIEAPERKRITSLAITTNGKDRGQPSQWSAALDALSAGVEDGEKKLIIVAAGNADNSLLALQNYPNSNYSDSIHDPAQAWNVLTIGAYTELTDLDPHDYPGYVPIAPVGDLSPYSCTSLPWLRAWPLKPDIVMEGGNAADDGTGFVGSMEALDVLTTNHDFIAGNLFITSRATSVATAQVARYAALIQAKYGALWPESIRGIIVHSANWTPRMLEMFAPLDTRETKQNLVRCYGLGVPNLDRALWSAGNVLTLIAQETMQPFTKDKSQYKSNEMHLHEIPWPVEALQDLGEMQVKLRVTLSYFVEPNPVAKGWKSRYRYESHGLRFEVKTPQETLEQFNQRINKFARDEEGGVKSKSDAGAWFLGPDLRGLGSIHTDEWTGTAADLAARGYIAVYPVMGWWRTRPKLGRWGNNARYALIVTISAPQAPVDLYTTITNLIEQPVEVAVEA
jgi:hypothetical protein